MLYVRNNVQNWSASKLMAMKTKTGRRFVSGASCSAESVSKGLKSLRMIQKQGNSRIEAKSRRTANAYVIPKAKREGFLLHRIVTKKNGYITIRPNTPMLWISWNRLELVCYKLLKSTEIFAGDLYRLQLRHWRKLGGNTNRAIRHIATCQNLLGNTQAGNSTQLALFTRHCFLWLLPIPI